MTHVLFGWLQVQAVHDAWPDKQLLFTEGCQEGGPHTGSWEVGERYARSIVNDLNRWTVGWIDWNLLLDEQGGPNHVGNFCIAPVHGDTGTGELTYTSSYWYIGHVSKFVQPGARRIACTSNDDDLLAATWILREPGSGTRQTFDRALPALVDMLQACVAGGASIGWPRAPSAEIIFD